MFLTSCRVQGSRIFFRTLRPLHEARAIKRRCVCLLVRELAVPRAAGVSRTPAARTDSKGEGGGTLGTSARTWTRSSSAPIRRGNPSKSPEFHHVTIIGLGSISIPEAALPVLDIMAGVSRGHRACSRRGFLCDLALTKPSDLFSKGWREGRERNGRGAGVETYLCLSFCVCNLVGPTMSQQP